MLGCSSPIEKSAKIHSPVFELRFSTADNELSSLLEDLSRHLWASTGDEAIQQGDAVFARV